jgi:hypothetical protein
LFGNRQQRRAALRVLRASGARIDMRNQAEVAELARNRQSWQSDAWGYRDMIGELRFAFQFLSRAVARVRFFAAEILPDEDDPIAFSDDSTLPADLRKAAQEELQRLPLSSGYHFTGVLAENLCVAGETWLHGYIDPDSGSEQWEALSVDEVAPSAAGTISIRRYGTGYLEDVDPDSEEMLRLWQPHPRYKNLADSPMRALLDVCEEVVLAGREIRAASRSRIAGNGILKAPHGLTLLNANKDDTTEIGDGSAFMAELTAALLAPIANEGDPGSVAPVVVQGEAEDLKEFQHMRIERAVAEDLLERVQQWMTRLARGLDIPPEILSGLGDSNHWSAWQIDASTYRYHIDPVVRIFADSLAMGFLRPALRARGFAAADIERITIWRDAGNLTENPNRGQDAKDAFDRGGISWAALRKALGFNDDDAPDDEELVKILAIRVGVDTGTAALMLQAALGTSVAPVGQSTPVQAQAKRLDAPKPPAPGQVPPDEGTPNTGQASAAGLALARMLTAAGAPAEESGWAIDDATGRTLMEIDRALRERLLIAADAALTRGLEVAGARMRSKAQRSAVTKQAVSGVQVLSIGVTLGRDQVLALGTNERELLDGSLDRLAEQFTAWSLAAIDRIVELVTRLIARLAPRRAEAMATRLRETLTGRVDLAWAWLKDALHRLAEGYLFNPHPAQEPGEVPGVLAPPSLIRAALAQIGGPFAATGGIDITGMPVRPGAPVGGIGQGQDVLDVLTESGAESLGYEWVYGETPRANTFEPHAELNTVRFATWQSSELATNPKTAWIGEHYAPGDHKGCLCDFVLVMAIPDRSQIVRERLGTETPAAQGNRALAEVDSAAGRTGTTAQHQRDERDRILELQQRFLAGTR